MSERSEHEPNDPGPVPPAPGQPPYGAPPTGHGTPVYGQAQQPAQGQPAYGEAQQPSFTQGRFSQLKFGQSPFGRPDRPAPYGTPVTGLPPGVVVAPLGDRLLARIIDGLIMFTVQVIVLMITDSAATAGGPGSATAWAAGVFGLLGIVGAPLIYEVALLSRRGATVGKKIMKLRVANLRDGNNPRVGTCLGRYGTLTILSLVGSMLLIGVLIVLLSPLFDKSGRRQGWWDKLAGTVVIKTG